MSSFCLTMCDWLMMWLLTDSLLISQMTGDRHVCSQSARWLRIYCQPKNYVLDFHSVSGAKIWIINILGERWHYVSDMLSPTIRVLCTCACAYLSPDMHWTNTKSQESSPVTDFQYFIDYATPLNDVISRPLVVIFFFEISELVQNFNFSPPCT